MSNMNDHINISIAELGRQLAESAKIGSVSKQIELAEQLKVLMETCVGPDIHPQFRAGLMAAAQIVAGKGQIAETDLESAE